MAPEARVLSHILTGPIETAESPTHLMLVECSKIIHARDSDRRTRGRGSGQVRLWVAVEGGAGPKTADRGR